MRGDRAREYRKGEGKIKKGKRNREMNGKGRRKQKDERKRKGNRGKRKEKVRKKEQQKMEKREREEELETVNNANMLQNQQHAVLPPLSWEGRTGRKGDRIVVKLKSHWSIGQRSSGKYPYFTDTQISSKIV